MKLLPVRFDARAPGLLWQLLEERPPEAWISHAGMPTRVEHEAFVHSHPFRLWLMIEAEGALVGAIECTHQNEIGIAVLEEYRRRGYATAALDLFLASYSPLPPLTAIRNGNWLVNIAAGNEVAKRFFRKRFAPLQETLVLTS